jgi:D-alanyl-D-alanine carboxypeptidase
MMTDVLVSQSNQEKFMMSLAAPGQRGTLRYRLGGLTIRAKTGSIEGVSTLSGYLWGEEGKAYAFSLMLNNYHGSSRALYQEIQNLLKSWSDR